MQPASLFLRYRSESSRHRAPPTGNGSQNISGGENSERVKLSLHRRHHRDLEPVHLERKPPAFDLSNPMLRRHRPAEGKHVSQRLFDYRFYSSKLPRITSGEILMRVSVAGVAVNYRLLDS